MQHSIGAKCSTQKPFMLGGLAGDNDDDVMTTRARGAVYIRYEMGHYSGLDLRRPQPSYQSVEAFPPGEVVVVSCVKSIISEVISRRARGRRIIISENCSSIYRLSDFTSDF